MDTESKSNSSPVMDVVAPPPAPSETEDHKAPAKKDDKATKATASKHASQPQEQSTGVGLAIFATIVIVLSLACLAVFAYLKQTK